MITPVPLDDVDAMLKRLHLQAIRRLYADFAVRAEQEGMSYRTFLEVLCAEEIAHRAQTAHHSLRAQGALSIPAHH